MDKNIFQKLTVEIYNKIFQSFESYDPDIVEADYNLDSVTITFYNKIRFVINRQPPVQQLWLATKNKGYHFNYDKERKIWICDKTQQEFTKIFNENVSQQLKEKYELSL